MSLRGLAYGSINDAHDEPSRPEYWRCLFASSTRWRVQAASASALTTAIWLLAVFGNARVDRVADTAAPLAWQDQQPLAAEFPTEFSENLKLPTEKSSTNGELRTTLSVSPAVAQPGPLTPALNVRAYNGSVPGPTLRIKPGDRLVVNLVNMLEEPEGDPMGESEVGAAGMTRGSLEGRVEGWPNVTNLHVHGLHVSPVGIADNIYRRAGPSEALEYVYDLPTDHYPGTFYYHPHFEGSSSVQTLGGMSGVIVVEDPPGTLSDSMKAMREVVMILQETNIQSGSLRNYKSASKIAGSKMPLYADGVPAVAENEEEATLTHFVTVNGQYQPVLHAQPQEALRVRLVHGGNNDHMHVSLVASPQQRVSASTTSGDQLADEKEKNGGTAAQSRTQDAHGDEKASRPSESREKATAAGCALLTLARDGVYLPAPRLLGGQAGGLVLSPGSRADVAVFCENPGVYRFVSSKGGGEGSQEVPLMEYLGKTTDVFEGTLAFLDVRGESMGMELPSKTPDGGRLLRDLRGLPKSEVSRFVFEFNKAKKISRLGQAYTWYGVNGAQYDVSRVSRRALLGSVEEWVIVNKRVGRGEGSEGCPASSTQPVSPSSDKSEENGKGGSRSRSRSRSRRRRLSKPRRWLEKGEEDKDVIAAAAAADSLELVGETSSERACERAGPGEATTETHPFHLHVNHFQIVDSSWDNEGPDWNVGDWRDTISIPSPGNVTIRWRAEDFTGKSVAHCHIFGHSDTGMMMNFEVYEDAAAP